MSTNPAVVNTGNDALPSSYPDLDATSPTDSVIAGDFGQMSSADQVSSYIYHFVRIPVKKIISVATEPMKYRMEILLEIFLGTSTR